MVGKIFSLCTSARRIRLNCALAETLERQFLSTKQKLSLAAHLVFPRLNWVSCAFLILWVSKSVIWRQFHRSFPTWQSCQSMSAKGEFKRKAWDETAILPTISRPSVPIPWWCLELLEVSPSLAAITTTLLVTCLSMTQAATQRTKDRSIPPIRRTIQATTISPEMTSARVSFLNPWIRLKLINEKTSFL